MENSERDGDTRQPDLPPKGDQSWVFIGRTDVEAETPLLWPSDVKSWLIWKDPDAGKDWGQEEKGMTEDEMIGWTQWTWIWADSSSWWWIGRPGVLWFMGSQTVRHDWVTELNWTILYKKASRSRANLKSGYFNGSSKPWRTWILSFSLLCYHQCLLHPQAGSETMATI